MSGGQGRLTPWPGEFLRRVNAEFAADGDSAGGVVEHANDRSSRRESAHSFFGWFQLREHIAKFERAGQNGGLVILPASGASAAI
jgi:hypothetical protein